MCSALEAKTRHRDYIKEKNGQQSGENTKDMQ